jgi:hypothetical protein
LFLPNKNRTKSVIATTYKLSLIIPSILAPPLIEKGLNSAWMLWLTSLIPLVTKEAVPLTIIGMNATARIIMTIRQIQGFMLPPFVQAIFFHFFLFQSLNSPQIKMSQIMSSAISYCIGNSFVTKPSVFDALPGIILPCPYTYNVS